MVKGGQHGQPGTDFFEVTQTTHGQVIVLSVSGDIDMLTAPKLTESVLLALTARPAGVVVDLSKVDFLASAGMTVLVAAHQEITPNARFGVVAFGPYTARPLHLVGLDGEISVYSTLDEALTDLSGE